MRVFETLLEAGLEIKRDVHKGIPQKSSRVQQFEDVELEGHERLGYNYGVLGGFPETPEALVQLAREIGLTFWMENGPVITRWLREEVLHRLFPEQKFHLDASEKIHPKLQSTLEGQWPSYRYTERLLGMQQLIHSILSKDPDSRRAYYPIYRHTDILRAEAPTRIPCSLGYQFARRMVGDREVLMMFYLQRSADFDIFWLSDVWLARCVQQKIAGQMDLEAGLFSHYIVSLHSFDNQEVY